VPLVPVIGQITFSSRAAQLRLCNRDSASKITISNNEMRTESAVSSSDASYRINMALCYTLLVEASATYYTVHI
jgi:hypothetical protein